jgi:hypothetical protein
MVCYRDRFTFIIIIIIIIDTYYMGWQNSEHLTAEEGTQGSV